MIFNQLCRADRTYLSSLSHAQPHPMADFILNAPDDVAEAEIVELLSKYPKRYLEKALSTPGDGDEKFIKKTLYDIKEASYLEHLERGERHKFWNPPMRPASPSSLWSRTRYGRSTGSSWGVFGPPVT